MKCVANYEVKAECSIVADNLKLRINHPRDLYRARIKNIPRQLYTTPFLLSVLLYFEAPALEDAEEVGEEYLADCLNMLAFTTGASFRRHRIRHIADATPGLGGRRPIRMWANAIEYEDPQPFLQEDSARTIERLLEFEVPSAIRRAMRWYRIGINATVPDDQFMYFWFALEIVAEYQKSTEKVPDKCPTCQSPLYCETCNTHPIHRPYAKQAIWALLKAVDDTCDDATIVLLDKTRNSLMHGSTLREIEANLPQPHEEIVDILGRLVWGALVNQFPLEFFDETLSMGRPSTYVHRKLGGAVLAETAVPVDADGDLDPSSMGAQANMVAFGPPQSALPTVVRMTTDQHKRLGQIRIADKEHQEMCERIFQRVKMEDDGVQALVLATDMALIEDAIKKGDSGPLQDLFQEIMSGKSEG